MKMAVLLIGNAFCVDGHRGVAGFPGDPISSTEYTKNKREFRAAELRFSVHKEFCAAEIRFYLHKEYVGAILKKIVILLKKNWSHMDNFKGAMLMKSSFY